MTAAAFALAAALGAVVRLQVNRLAFGWLGTLGVNVTGAFGLGWLMATAGDDTALIVGTAALGSLTTFSTFALEAAEAGSWWRRLLVIATTVGCGLLAAAGGHALGT